MALLGWIVAAGLAFAQSPVRDLSLEKGRQLALVVGNANYTRSPLRNPVNDANSVAATLRDLGFQTDSVVNVGLRDLDRSISQFVSKVSTGDVVMFYYAGHGIQIEGENYLVPVDFDAKDETDAKYAAYSATRVQERLEKAGARVVLVVLDACRNNPYQATRSSAGGLAAMGSGKGTLIAFATAPGKTADDNPSGNNGLFTSHLVTALKEPGLSIDQVFNRVRERVYKESNGRQVPWTVSSVIGDLYLRPQSAAATPQPPPQNPLVRRVAPAPAPEPPPAINSREFVTAGMSALERGDLQDAMTKAQEVLRVNPKDADALQLLASAYYRGQQWNLFLSTARLAAQAGAKLQFLLGHHHTLTGIHPATLTVTKDSVAFQPLGGACNQPPIEVLRKDLVSASGFTSPQGEIFLNVRIRDEKNKQRVLNFADSESTIGKNSAGLPMILSPPRAPHLIQAITGILLPMQQ